jgi:hypothetical protein
MKRLCIHILLISPFIFLTMNSHAKNDPYVSLPDSIDGWTKLSDDRIFNEENLYDYIDGGAELYLSFGFSKVFNRIYSTADGQEILVDIVYMNSSQDAFGVFSFTVGEIGTDYGQQSQMAPGAIVFWKDKYYVSIFSNPVTEESTRLMGKLAHLIDDSITEEGKLPEILDYLPKNKLDKQSIRYFRHYVWMNSHYFISNKNILNINQNTHGVLAKYGDTEKSVLMVIKYPSLQDAVAAKENFVKNYENGILKSGMAKSETGKWLGIELVNNFFLGVFNAVNMTDLQILITQAKELINVSNKKPE